MRCSDTTPHPLPADISPVLRFQLSLQVLKHKQTKLDLTVLRNELHDLQGMVSLEVDTALDKFGVLEKVLGPQPRMRDSFRPSVVDCARAYLAGTPVGSPNKDGVRPRSSNKNDKNRDARTGFVYLAQQKPEGIETAHNLHHTETPDKGVFLHQHTERYDSGTKYEVCMCVCAWLSTSPDLSFFSFDFSESTLQKKLITAGYWLAVQ